MRGRSGCGRSIDRVQARVDMCLPSDRSIPSYTAAMMGSLFRPHVRASTRMPSQADRLNRSATRAFQQA